MVDTVKEFNRLTQGGTSVGISNEFEEFKSLMFSRNLYMIKEYFVSSFMRGLNNELRLAVKMLKSKTCRRR